MKDNRRILIVDDQEDLRLQVARLLRADSANTSKPLLDQIRKRLSRNQVAAPDRDNEIHYDVETVGEGQAAFEQVKASAHAGRPYAVLFLDMRMPGWDGLRTAQNIRAVDKDLEIVIMTAYADYSQEELVHQIGVAEKLLYLKKPFQPEEVRQLARALTEKWNLTQRERERLTLTNRLMHESTALTRGAQRNLGESARAILGAFISFLDADRGLVARLMHGELEVCAITNPAEESALIERSQQAKSEGRCATDEGNQAAYFPIVFEEFDGFIYVEGKSISFDFEQLRPFLDILSETSREVLKNMFLLQQHSREKRLAVLGTAMRRISHAMDSELEVVRQVAEQLAEDGKRKEVLDRAVRRLDRLSSNIAQFSDARREPAKQAIRVVDLLQAACESIRDRLEAADVDVRIFGDAHETSLMADSELLEFSISRLLENSVNALEALPPAQERRIELQCEAGDLVSIVVTDTGPGISPEIMTHLFDPFMSAGDGLGLGATIARQAINQHGGSIRAEPADQGARLVIQLPKAEP